MNLGRAPIANLSLALALASLGTGCATTSVDDPAMLKLADLESRLIRIERVMDNQSMLDLVTQVEQLQGETRELRGQLEELQHATESSRDSERQRYVDLDERLQGLERRGGAQFGGGVVAGAAVVGSGQIPVPGGDDKANYQAAFDLLKDGQYNEAARAFSQFLAAFPDSVLVDNAQYWYAETKYVSRAFADALPAFQTVISQYPDSRKVPDALLKIGYCNYELKNWNAARTALGKVTQDYPDTTAARLASKRLVRMDSEGH